MIRSVGRIIVLTVALSGLQGVAAQPAARATPQSLDLAAFIARIDEIDGILSRGGPRSTTEALVRMPPKLSVRHGDQTFEVPLEPLAQVLVGRAATPPDRVRIARQQLQQIRNAAESLAKADTTVDGAALRSSLQAILERREFTRLRRSGWWAGVSDRLREWLLSWFERLGGDRVNARMLGTALAWTVLVAAVSALAFWFYRRARTGRLASPTHAPLPVATAARALGLRAVAAARAGDAAEAVRSGYQAAVIRFSEQGAWRLDDARTAREYLDLLAPGETKRPLFADIAEQFERVFYGKRSVTAADLSRLFHHLETLGCVPAQDPSI